MRKFVLAAAAVAGVFALSACKSKTEETVTTESTEMAIDTAATDAAAEASGAAVAASGAAVDAAGSAAGAASEAAAAASSAM